MSTEQYLISELAQRAGVSVRTIRYYISEGLLPPPQVRGRYSVYDEDYVERIHLVKRLKEAYLPIREIRKKLETQTMEEIDDFLRHYEKTSGPGNDALDYISGLLQQKETGAFMDQQIPSAPNVPSPKVNENITGGQPEPGCNQDGTNWRRFVISSGLELHVSDQVFSQSPRSIQRLIEDIKQRFLRNGSGNL
jgi:DNA-binding transcriptional MerR regulator